MKPNRPLQPAQPAADLAAARERLRRFTPRRKWGPRLMQQSAVAVMLREGEAGLETLMIKRAEFRGDPWSGHMAFPGGRRERSDWHSRGAAERETLEEVGVNLARADYLGPLSDVRARLRRGPLAMVVTPHLYALDHHPAIRCNYEVAEALWIPLPYFADPANRQWMRLRHLRLPCVWYRGRRVWGLSLRMLDELVTALSHAPL